jgi:hypothetical protein
MSPGWLVAASRHRRFFLYRQKQGRYSTRCIGRGATGPAFPAGERTASDEVPEVPANSTVACRTSGRPTLAQLMVGMMPAEAKAVMGPATSQWATAVG